MHKFIAVMDPEAELSAVTCIAFHFLKLSVCEADSRRRQPA